MDLRLTPAIAVMSVALTVSTGWAQVAAPRGYRMPTDADIAGAWQIHRAEFPTPYVVKGDFDHDGRTDEAWLFTAVKGLGWALFAFLAQANGRHHAWQLAGDPGSRLQMYGIRDVPPGCYDTTCGRGYLECPHPELKSLTLTAPAVELVQFDKARSIFWWDAKSRAFKRTWITD
ncbi:MAG: hypothetical protein FJW27_02360 [Acidimicrobiia bacterium]|nr:hypothetical protein [Acidimicrobiia bacterium]